MTIILGTGFVLSEADEVPGTPWIGWHNLVTVSNIEADLEEVGFPVTNLANPSTALKWMPTTPLEDQTVTVTVSAEVDYMGVAGHNFGTSGMAVSVEGLVTNPAIDTQTRLLLHFDDTGSPDVFTDSSANPKTFTAVGNARIDTAQSVFGGTSGRFDGTGDRITTPDHADFVLGTVWTIDFWIRFDGATITDRGIAEQRVDANNRISIRAGSTGRIRLILVSGGSTLFSLNSAVADVVVADTWHHVAFTSDGTTARVFLDGGLSASLATASVPDFAAAWEIGRAQDESNPEFDGWIDEFRIRVGVAAWTEDFDVPTIAGPWVQLTSPAVPANDSPIMFRWELGTYYQVRLRIGPGSEIAQAAVIYVGELLVCERSIDVNVDHVPVTYGRRTHVVNGMSQSGEFLGRIVLGEHRFTVATFKWFQDDWWRENFEPFLEAAESIPFFWAWSPEEYPAEAGYVWLTQDADVAVDPVTRRVHTELEMEGVA